jgi:ankyrin repeat protein
VTAGKIQVQLGGVNRVCWNEIQEAMLDDDLEKLADFLRRDPGCLEIRNESGLSLLQFYCLDGYFSKIAAFLLDHGADLEIKDQFGRTPLWHACNYIRENDGDETLNMLNELAYLLIDRGADVNSSDNDGVSVLHLAVAHHDYGLTRYLLVKGSDPNAKIEATDGLYNNSLILLDNHSGVPATVGSTPLHLSPGLAIAKLLVFYGADRHALDANGRLPHECASNPQVQKFLASTESGIDPGSNLSKSYQY